jgi:hypothetical protein
VSPPNANRRLSDLCSRSASRESAVANTTGPNTRPSAECLQPAEQGNEHCKLAQPDTARDQPV